MKARIEIKNLFLNLIALLSYILGTTIKIISKMGKTIHIAIRSICVKGLLTYLSKITLMWKGPEYHRRAVMVELWDWELEGIKYPGMTELYISTNDTQNWRLQFKRGNAERIRLDKRLTTEELFDLIRPSIVYVRGIR